MANESNKKNASVPTSSDTPKPAEEPAAQSPAIAEVIPPELTSVLRTAGVNPSDPNVSQAIRISLTMFGGPIPPPSILVQYNKVFPGLAEKIVGWTEQQRDHRQSLERQRSEGSQRRMNRGQLIGAGVAFLGLILSAIVGIWGNPWVAGIIAIVCVGGPTAAVAMALTLGRSTPDSGSSQQQPGRSALATADSNKPIP